MTAWGKTGRVELLCVSEPGDPWEWNNVLVDRDPVGCADFRRGGWDSGTLGRVGQSPRHESRDAAVMWVLRRARPDVWRAERPIVWRVIPMWPISAFPRGRYGEIDTRPQRAATRWGAAPDGRTGDFATRDTWADAMHEALERSRAAHARQVNR